MTMENARHLDDEGSVASKGTGGLIHSAINEASRLVSAEIQWPGRRSPNPCARA